MMATLTLDRSPAHPGDEVDDSEFDLDLRVVESTSRVAIMLCDTSDGCGNTCQTSACNSASQDPS